MDINEDWEHEAERWIAWARTPDHDVYWVYRQAFFDLLPAPGRATLEVGCGEGRVARDLARLGHRVVAVDAAPTLLDAARAADSAGEYVLADAARLPFGDRSFDLVVAYNSLMDVQDMPGAVREAGRVLEAGGRLCVCVTHPTQETGRFVTGDSDAPFVIEGSYLGRKRFEATFERGGLTMTFRGWAYALEEYGGALEQAGLLIEAVREPGMPVRSGEHEGSDERWRRLPMFLMMRVLKPAQPSIR